MQRRTFIAALVLAGFFSACSRDIKLSAIPAGKSVLAFGDSVTFGIGDTAEAGKLRIQALLDEHKPALVILEMGGNDFLRRRSQQAVKDDLRRIIQQVRQTGAQIVLVAVPELSLLSVVARRPSDAPIYRELAEEEKIPLINDVFSDILARPELCADQIHPNAKGYKQMASGIHAQLKRLGLIAAAA